LFPTGFRFFSHPAKDTFQLSLTLLVNYRSRVVFRIGSSCLPSSRAISNARYSGLVTWSYYVHIRDFHPLWCAVPGDFYFHNLDNRRSKPHISPWFPMGIRFVLFRFHSPLLTESHLISFPLPTEMLQFRRFPFHLGMAQSARRSYSAICGSKRFMPLPATFRSLSRPSSALEPSHPPVGL
jgi:hypothetical protein